MIVLATFACITTWILYTALCSLSSACFHAAEAKRLGCQPAQAKKAKGLPFGIQFLRKTLQAGRRHTYLDSITKLMNRNMSSTLEFNTLGSKNIVTRDPENIRAILQTQFQHFGLGRRKQNFHLALGHGIFTSDGLEWKRSREMLRPQFKKEQLCRFGIEPHVQNLISSIQVQDDGWTARVDLQELFYQLTFDMSTEFLFDQPLSNLQGGISTEKSNTPSIIAKKRDEIAFSEVLNLVQGYLGSRTRLGYLYYVIDSFSFRRAISQINQSAENFVQAALNRLSSWSCSDKVDSQVDDPNRFVFLDKLTRETQDPFRLRSEILQILIAARDTTAVSLSWTFFHLARHPLIYLKLRMLILARFGTFDSFVQAESTFSDLRACTYLQYVISEALRLQPAIPINSRTALCSTTLPRGGGADGQSPVYLRKGQEVTYCVYALHRNPAIWDGDAEQFRPERWEGRRKGWEYLPFNGGPRICLGKEFALMQLSYTIMRMVQRYDLLENMDDVKQPVVKVTLTCSSGTGVKVRLRTSLPNLKT